MTDLRLLLGIVTINIAIAIGSSGCGEPGVISVTRVPGSEAGAPATPGKGSSGDAQAEEPVTEKCPTGYNCMDIGALGFDAKDGDGKAITASCSMGGVIPCDDANPAASCKDLTTPICAHLSVSGMEIVSCGQRCTP